MRKLTATLLRKTGNALLAFSRITHPPSRNEAYDRWVRDSGDATLRLDYGLTETSVVFDCGGYRGQWASDIFARYRCTIHVFEPVPAFAASIRKRFEKNDRIFVHPFGLADKNQTGRIAVCNEGSSIFRAAQTTVAAEFCEAAGFMKSNAIAHIDLMKINIEGGEYPLLEHLLETGLIRSIDNVQVQFHDIEPDSARRMAAIQEKLRHTHDVTYSYRFVWENWRIKGQRATT